jgi:hypothetical protein
MLVLVLLSITNSLREINLPRMTVTFDQWPRWMKNALQCGRYTDNHRQPHGPILLSVRCDSATNISEEEWIGRKSEFWLFLELELMLLRQTSGERERKNKRECLSAHELLVKNEK